MVARARTAQAARTEGCAVTWREFIDVVDRVVGDSDPEIAYIDIGLIARAEFLVVTVEDGELRITE